MMIDRALDLRRTLDSYCIDSEAQNIKDDTITVDEWDDLTVIKEILQPLYDNTKDLVGCVVDEGREGLLYEVVLAVEGLMEGLMEHKRRVEHTEDENLKISVNAAITLLDKYLKLTQKSTA